MKRKSSGKSKIFLITTLAALTLAGCGSQTSTTTATTGTQLSGISVSTSTGTTTTTSTTTAQNTMLDTTDMFSARDLEQTADLTGAEYITLTSGKDITISKEGVYVISGNASEVTITVAAPEDAKVQIVLNGVTVTNTDAPVIYVKTADKVFVTTASVTNSMKVTGTFTADGDTNLDAVIFSKTDLVLNGTGTLEIVSSKGNGITTKDDLKVTGGTYKVTSALDGFEANDSIRIYNGDINVVSGKDAFHSENEDDTSVGYIYIQGGNLTISAAEDAMQATSIFQMDGGKITVTKCVEGIEATYIQINDGTINIASSDDGINASKKSTSYDVIIEINGGNITIVMASGDTDAVDANGSIYVNGGVINITAPTSSFDYDVEGKINGGTVTVNGTAMTVMVESMMGGPTGGNKNFKK